MSHYLQGFIRPRWCRILPSTVFQPVMRCWCRSLDVNWHHLSWFLLALSTNWSLPLGCWSLYHYVTLTEPITQEKAVGRRAGGHVWVGHWYSTRWVLMQRKERGGGKAWPKTSGCNHKKYGYPWKSRWCKVWKTFSGFMVVQERFIKGSLVEKLPIYERHPSKVK